MIGSPRLQSILLAVLLDHGPLVEPSAAYFFVDASVWPWMPASAWHSIQLVLSPDESASQRFRLDRQRAAFATYEMPDEVRFGWAALQVNAVAATY